MFTTERKCGLALAHHFHGTLEKLRHREKGLGQGNMASQWRGQPEMKSSLAEVAFASRACLCPSQGMLCYPRVRAREPGGVYVQNLSEAPVPRTPHSILGHPRGRARSPSWVDPGPRNARLLPPSCISQPPPSLGTASLQVTQHTHSALSWQPHQ